MDELISIIIPVYNVEKYIEQCLASVKNQTYHNLQVIIVDDGSTDATLACCKKYADSDPRFTVISIPNSGVSAARNKVLEIVKGNFLGFVDGDDLLEPQMFELLLAQIKKERADIAICGFDRLECITGKIDQMNWTSYSQEELVERIYVTHKLDVERTLWHMLFRWSCVPQIRFDEDIINGEDNLYIMKAFLASSKICITDAPLYHYIKRSNSLTDSVSYQKALSRFLSSSRQVDLLIESYPQYQKKMSEMGLIDAVNFAKKISEQSVEDDSIKRYVTRCVKKYLPECSIDHFSFWVYGNLLKNGWDVFEKCYRFVYKKRGGDGRRVN